jgi:hypothetical protein
MTKYDKFSPQSRMAGRPWKIHPIWRGIGCLMMILIPIISYAGAVLLVQENITRRWVPVPVSLAQAVQIPLIGSVSYLYANLIVTALLAIIGFGILTIGYSVLYSSLGPPRYGPMDAPPERRRAKKSR